MSHPKCPSTALGCHGASVTSGPSWRAGAPQPPQPLPHSWLRPSISVRNGGTHVSSQLCKLRGFTSNTHVLFPSAPLPVPCVLMFHLRNGIYSAQIKPPPCSIGIFSLPKTPLYVLDPLPAPVHSRRKKKKNSPLLSSTLSLPFSANLKSQAVGCCPL